MVFPFRFAITRPGLPNGIQSSIVCLVPSQITGRDDPLRSFDILVEAIRSTTTRKGLKVDAVLNSKEYQKGIKVSDSQMKAINIIRHDELPKWNYSLVPKSTGKYAN
jgi:hypothetical protein